VISPSVTKSDPEVRSSGSVTGGHLYTLLLDVTFGSKFVSLLIITIIYFFMQAVYSYVPETNHVYRVCGAAAVL
jgi:hypothetical protein